MNIGKAIKLCRTQKNLNQSQLAKLAGISESYLSQIENNKRDPNLSTVENIAGALNIPFSILIFLAAEKNELEGINSSIVEKLSYLALKLMENSNNQ
jgi:transcriptional regulator with XRE-family HTH domain